MLRKLIDKVRKTLGGKSGAPRTQPPKPQQSQKQDARPEHAKPPQRHDQPQRPAHHAGGGGGGGSGRPPRHYDRGGEHRYERNDRRDGRRPGSPHERRDHGRPRREKAPAAVHGDWTADKFVVQPVEGKTRFHDLGLPGEIMHAISDLNFEYCTPVQAGVLPIALKGKDVAGQAQTGSGKTAAFLLTAFSRFLAAPMPGERQPGTPRALVLAPTRELAVQIEADAAVLGKYCGLNSIAVYGGIDYVLQKDALRNMKVDVLVATPGRLLDFRRQGNLDLRSVEILVIDEADRMLDMGFIPDVKTIVHALPPKDKRQTMLFSATLSSDVMRLASQWMVDPVKVRIEAEKVTVDMVRQLVYAVGSRDRLPVLINLLKQPGMTRVMVFANRRDSAADVEFALKACGIRCALMSGAMPQEKRMRVLQDFKENRVNVLVATDVASRGIHVEDISHVINYDVPYEPEDYVHRIGRTARVGKEGDAITLACENEAFTIPEIEKYIGMSIPCVQPEEALLRLDTDPAKLMRPREKRRFGRDQGGFGRDRGGPRRGPPRGGGRGGPRRGPPRRP